MGAVAAGASIAGTAISVGSSLFDDSSSKAASAKAEAATLNAQTSFFNAQRSMLEAVRVQNESDMEKEWTYWTYDREAMWVEAWTPVEVAYGKLFAGYQKLSAIQEADTAARLAVDMALMQAGLIFKTSLQEADIANMTAEAKAKYTEARGRSESGQVASERKFQLNQLLQEARQQEGEIYAQVANQGREMTGSAIDVLRKFDDANGKKSAYLKLKADADIRDIDFSAGYEAATARQTGHLQAWEVINDAVNKGSTLIAEAEIKNDAYKDQLKTTLGQIDAKLEYDLLHLTTESDRYQTQLREEGWRSVFKLDQSTQNQIWGLQYDMMDQVWSGSNYSSAASKYEDEASSTDWSKFAKAGSSLLGGVSSVYDTGVKSKWWS